MSDCGFIDWMKKIIKKKNIFPSPPPQRKFYHYVKKNITIMLLETDIIFAFRIYGVLQNPRLKHNIHLHTTVLWMGDFKTGKKRQSMDLCAGNNHDGTTAARTDVMTAGQWVGLWKQLFCFTISTERFFQNNTLFGAAEWRRKFIERDLL